MSFTSVVRFLSYIMLFIAAVMAVPLAMAAAYGETDAFHGFMLTIVLMVLTSVFVLNITSGDKELRIGTRESMLIVSLTWVIMTAYGALPLYLSHSMESYSECFFEIMSGFSTAGATVLSDIEVLDRSVLFWRGMTNWLGGMGVVVLFVAVLPIFGVKGNALVGAETVGPSRSKFTPTIRGTAVGLWCIYIGLSALETILLMLGGLDAFNALSVMFGTMGAAGFAPLNDSIGGYGSAYVEWICTIFMFLAGINFTLFYYAVKRNFRKIAGNGEFRLYLAIFIVSTALISSELLLKGAYGSFSSAIRDAAFHVASMMTTTGYVTADFNQWPMFSQMIMIVICFIGACSGSAGGGMKVIRIGVMLRLGYNSMLKRIHPNSVSAVKFGTNRFDSSSSLSIAGYVGCYFITLFAGSIVISLTDFDFLTCFSSVFLCLGNLGTGIGGLGTSFTFDIFPRWALWVFSFLMLVGRLEFYTIYTLFMRAFWRC